VLILTLLFPVDLTLYVSCASSVPVHHRLLQERRVRVLHWQQRHLLLQQRLQQARYDHFSQKGL
jgi:hypothetical protein